MTSFFHTFVGGTVGRWRVERIQVIVGQTLPSVPRLWIFEGNQSTTLEGSIWLLRGVTSYERYVHKTERSALVVHVGTSLKTLPPGLSSRLPVPKVLKQFLLRCRKG